MVGHTTLGIQATNTRTRVRALLVDARSVAWAIAVDHALWATTAVRITEVLRQTGAGAGTVTLTTLGIRATRRGYTRCQMLIGYGNS